MNDTSFENCIKCTVCTTACPVSRVNPGYPGPKQAGPDGERLRLKDGALYDEALKYCGFFLIAETDFKKTTAEILDIYRCRDTIEKSFDDLKNGLDMKRLHIHTSETAQGKVFVSFLSLIVRAYLLRQLKDYMRKNGLTLKKILLELDKIKTIQYPGSDEERLLNPLTKRQREIYELLEIPVPGCIG